MPSGPRLRLGGRSQAPDAETRATRPDWEDPAGAAPVAAWRQRCARIEGRTSPTGRSIPQSRMEKQSLSDV